KYILSPRRCFSMSFALIFQSVEKPDVTGHFHSTNALVVTRHPIFMADDGRAHSLGTGMQVCQDDLNAMRQMLGMDIPSYGGWLGDDLLYLSESLMVWHVPGQLRPMYFKPPGQKRSQQYLVRWPHLIMQYHTQKDFRIAAYAAQGKPCPSTRLYHAPLMNVYDNTTICLGSANGGDGLTAQARAIWNEAIFDSNFSHKNHDRLIRLKSTVKEKDINRAYLRFIRDKAATGKPFYAKDMTPLGKTLDEWIVT
ncbi:hypothetical protein, partial [Thiolapillus sp.]|uniref:hypothetical protein n=5 Tax=Thiolapillus sp. TaxID=2017437 RepID=UPI003AF51A76